MNEMVKILELTPIDFAGRSAERRLSSGFQPIGAAAVPGSFSTESGSIGRSTPRWRCHRRRWERPSPLLEARRRPSWPLRPVRSSVKRQQRVNCRTFSQIFRHALRSFFFFFFFLNLIFRPVTEFNLHLPALWTVSWRANPKSFFKVSQAKWRRSLFCIEIWKKKNPFIVGRINWKCE